MSRFQGGYEVQRLPIERLPQVEMLRIFARRPTMHGLLEVDVTTPRRLIQDERIRTGTGLSFTAFLVGCLARAVDENRQVQAFRKGRRHLIVFDEVDVATLIEVDAGHCRVPLFYVVRDAASKSVREVHEEIRAAQSDKAGLDTRRRQIRRVRLLPRPIRTLLWRGLATAPKTWKRYGGTVVLTSVGMFANGPGWGLSTPGGYPLGLTVGGIAERPMPVAGSFELCEYISLTVSFDHAVVDGAPATRFAARLKQLIEEGAGLCAPR